MLRWQSARCYPFTALARFEGGIGSEALHSVFSLRTAWCCKQAAAVHDEGNTLDQCSKLRCARPWVRSLTSRVMVSTMS